MNLIEDVYVACYLGITLGYELYRFMDWYFFKFRRWKIMRRIKGWR